MAAPKVSFIPTEQEIIDTSVRITDIPGKGRGLVVTRDFNIGDQILFINRPLLLNLGDSWLRDTCYHCLRSGAFNTEYGSVKFQKFDKANLKNCGKCKAVKYCST